MPFEGILLIDKPQGFTSFDVIAKLRGITKTKRIGHSGTLDPMATGVLPIFFGRSAKASGILPRDDKRYIAQIKLGITTDTLDVTGKTLSETPVTVTCEEVCAVALSFAGDIFQVPPMYSALKVDGKKLCDLARKGVTIERKPRPVTIYNITCKQIDCDVYELDVHCSKGTYIRTLAADLGEKIGCGAALCGLQRVMAAGFSIEDCVTMEEAQTLGLSLEQRLMPIESAFISLPKVPLTPEQTRMYQNGVQLDARRVDTEEIGRVAVYDGSNFLGTAFIEADELCMEKLFRLIGG